MLQKILSKVRREPALVTALVVAVLNLVAAYGLPLSEDQKSALLGLVSAVLAVLGGVAVRARVTPVDRPGDERGASDDEVIRSTAKMLLPERRLFGPRID